MYRDIRDPVREVARAYFADKHFNDENSRVFLVNLLAQNFPELCPNDTAVSELIQEIEKLTKDTGHQFISVVLSKALQEPPTSQDEKNAPVTVAGYIGSRISKKPDDCEWRASQASEKAKSDYAFFCTQVLWLFQELLPQKTP